MQCNVRTTLNPRHNLNIASAKMPSMHPHALIKRHVAHVSAGKRCVHTCAAAGELAPAEPGKTKLGECVTPAGWPNLCIQSSAELR